MRINFSAVSLFLALILAPPASLAQEQKAPATLNRNSIEWFYEAAEHHSDTLLLKALQFTAPYTGFYQELSLDRKGKAFNARIVPNWAIQASQTATLDDKPLDQIRQMLTELTIASGPSPAELQPGQLRTALAFYNGKTYERYDFNGALPAQVQAILDIIKTELEREARIKYVEFLRHHELMEETYGDWQNESGVAVVSGSSMHGLRGTHGLLLTLTGQRKTIPASPRTPVSIYHALVFYPGGGVTGSGSSGSWSDDPLSTEVVVWTLPNRAGPGSERTSERKLEIEYQAIDGTISVGGNIYQLVHGNMFVIRISENWTPIVNQLDAKFDEKTTEQSVLERFKSTMRNDASIQLLELN